MRILHIRPGWCRKGSQNSRIYHIFPCPIYISSSAMAEAAKQVTTLAVLVSQHAVVTHLAVVALQQERQEKRQQQLQLFVHNRMVGKVKTNGCKSQQMSYDHYKCLAIRPKRKKKKTKKKLCFRKPDRPSFFEPTLQFLLLSRKKIK